MEKKMMKAWRLYDFNDIRLEEVPIPELRDGWVLCRIEAFQPSVTEVQRIKGFGVEGLEKVKKRLEKMRTFFRRKEGKGAATACCFCPVFRCPPFLRR